ncbi:hypothetical protein ACLB2K_077416 [Fragaria x ananassa]
MGSGFLQHIDSSPSSLPPCSFSSPGEKGDTKKEREALEYLAEDSVKKSRKKVLRIRAPFKEKKTKELNKKRNPTHFCYSHHRISPETEEHSEAPLNSISIELGCMSDIWTGFCRVEEEKDFGGGLTAWGGQNLAKGGGEDGCGGERERGGGGERQRERETGQHPKFAFDQDGSTCEPPLMQSEIIALLSNQDSCGARLLWSLYADSSLHSSRSLLSGLQGHIESTWKGKHGWISAKIFKLVDLDGDGFINFKVFMEVHKKAGGVKTIDIQNVFQTFDLNGDGKISAEEVMEVLKRLGERWNLEECQRMVRAVDTDGDGMVDLDEFMAMMTPSMRRV